MLALATDNLARLQVVSAEEITRSNPNPCLKDCLMHPNHFFDYTLRLIEQDTIPEALLMLVGKLYGAKGDPAHWSLVRQSYQAHPLRSAMLEDPYIARCVEKPRGYPGDAKLIDMIYDRKPPAATSSVGRKLFNTSIAFPAAEAVRLRRTYAEQQLLSAHRAGQRILSLACGHFREGDPLAGQDLSNIVLVDQDPRSLDKIRQRHGAGVNCHQANVFSWLRGAISRGETFDLVYTLGLTDYLDDRAMALLHKMVTAVLAPGGTFLLANFVPSHPAVGWLDAVMDWHLIYREPAELAAFAQDHGLTARTWLDPTHCIAWCKMQAR